jgi:hypothetical protein
LRAAFRSISGFFALWRAAIVNGMEDEGYVDDDFIEDTAGKFVIRHGNACLGMLLELARASEAGGDHVSAETWRAVAEAAERILGAT